MRTTDDIERDHVLRQRILLFGWLREEHLDVPTGVQAGQGGKEVKGFLDFAQQGLAHSIGLSICVMLTISTCHVRAAEDQSLQSPTRQTDLHFELLQGHLWYFPIYSFTLKA